MGKYPLCFGLSPKLLAFKFNGVSVSIKTLTGNSYQKQNGLISDSFLIGDSGYWCVCVDTAVKNYIWNENYYVFLTVVTLTHLNKWHYLAA